jgi:hypothetical protein
MQSIVQQCWRAGAAVECRSIRLLTVWTCLQMLGKGELAPGLHHSEFQQRRQNLANLMPPGSLAVIPAASLAFVTGVIPYPYRQDAEFLYLTGIQQQAVALVRTGGKA